MEQQKMERGLKPRHVEMIALGEPSALACLWGRPTRFKWQVRRYCSAMPLRVSSCFSLCVSWGNVISGTGNRIALRRMVINISVRSSDI